MKKYFYGNVLFNTPGQTRSITAENVYGEKGRGSMAEVSGEDLPETHATFPKLGSRDQLEII